MTNQKTFLSGSIRRLLIFEILISLLLGGLCSEVRAEKYILEKAEKYRLSGQYQLALQELERLLAGPERDNGDVHYSYAFMLRHEGGDRAKVKHHLKEGLRISPYSWEADDGKRLLAKIEFEEKEEAELAAIPGARVGIVLVRGNHVEKVEAYSPAATVGIVPGDKIEYVNNVSTSGMSTKSVMTRLCGPAGSKILATVSRKGVKFNCYLTRALAAKTGTSIGAKQGSPISSSKAQAPSVPTTNVPPKTLPPTEQATVIPVEIYRRTQRATATEKLVKAALAYVPSSVQESMHQAGIVIFIVPDMLMVRPHLATQKLPAYASFGGYDNVCGLFMPGEKKVYIPERFSFGNQPLQDNPFVLWATLHELGHAFDSVENYSDSESFIKAYEDDCKYLNNEIRITYNYFLEHNGRRHEMFAELFSACVAPKEDLRAAGLSKAFPRCTQAVKDTLGK